jgi:hypothetical protein
VSERVIVLRGYHNRLATARHLNALYRAHDSFWRGKPTRPKGVAKLFNAHLDRVQGRGTIEDCNAALREVLK